MMSSTPKMPTLQRTVLEPNRPSRAAAPLEFLRKIEDVEITKTIKIDGTVYYVIDVYRTYNENRLPCNRDAGGNRKRARPDYTILKRFTDFANLRHRIWSYAQRYHIKSPASAPEHIAHSRMSVSCAYCDAFMNYIIYKLAQPRLLVKLGTGKHCRQKLLQTFVNEFLRMTVADDQAEYRCDGFEYIPILMEEFLKPDSREPAPASAPTVLRR